jgi:hypothetical protein
MPAPATWFESLGARHTEEIGLGEVPAQPESGRGRDQEGRSEPAEGRVRDI